MDTINGNRYDNNELKRVVREEQAKPMSKHIGKPRPGLTKASDIMRLSMNIATQVGKLHKHLRDLENSTRLDERDALLLRLEIDVIEVTGWMIKLYNAIPPLIAHEELYLGTADILREIWVKRHRPLGPWDLSPFLELLKSYDPSGLQAERIQPGEGDQRCHHCGGLLTLSSDDEDIQWECLDCKE